MAERFLDVWVNCPDRESAERIAEAAIGERLAACANILAPVSSIYRWKGAVERAGEVPLLIKTRASLFDALAARVKALHAYETPSIVATELTAVENDYAAWLAEETQGASSGGEYRPRRAWFQEMAQAGPVAIKLNAICADGAQIDADAFARARACIGAAGGQVAASDHRGAGFAILHEGEEGRWLLLHWWLSGGMTARRLWRAELAPGRDFADADPLLSACVWEFGLIDFEPRAWMRTVMSGGTVGDYIEDRFSGDSV